MDQQIALNVAAACFGVVAALWLCLGTALIHPKTIEWFADEPWDSAEVTANALISQSAQYLAGALLLILAFALQVGANLTERATPLVSWLAQLGAFTFVLLSLFLASAIGAAVFWLQRARLANVVLPRIKKLKQS
jgi:hypothetical protein